MKKQIIIIAVLAAVIAAVLCFFLLRREKTTDRRITVTVNGKVFTAVLYDNKTADELYGRLPLTLEMKELNGNEKFFDLPEKLPADSKAAVHISEGDIKLYGDDCLVLFYDSFASAYSYTDIGYIEDTDGLAEALGSGGVTVSFGKESSAESTQTEATKKPAETTETTATATAKAEQPEATEQTTTEAPALPITEEEKTMKLEIAGVPVEVEWEKNEAAAALEELCREQPLEIQLSMYGGFEQVGPIGTSLPREDVQTTTEAGDIVLYSGDQIVVFYGSNSWSYTRLGHITDSAGHTLEELLGGGDVTIKISLG